MEQFFGVLIFIIYIVITVVGAALKKSASQQAQTPQMPTSVKPRTLDLQGLYQKYSTQIETYLEQQQAQGAAETTVRAKRPSKSKTTPVLATPAPFFEVDEQRRAAEATQALEALLQATDLPDVAADSQRAPKPAGAPLLSILSLQDSQGYLQGMVMSEILGPPLCKRQRS